MKNKELMRVFKEKTPDIHDNKAFIEGIKYLLQSFINDLHSINKSRGVSLVTGFVSVVDELNTKWNSLAKSMEREYGVGILVKHGFLGHIYRSSPELWNYYTSKGSGAKVPVEEMDFLKQK